MLIRGQTTEDRIAEIAQGFGQGVQNFQQVQNQQRAQDLQAEALKRQQALQAFEVENKLAEQTGKIVPQGTGLAILSGQNIDLAGALKSAPSTRKAELEAQDRIYKAEERALNKQLKEAQVNELNKPFEQTRDYKKAVAIAGVQSSAKMDSEAMKQDMQLNKKVREASIPDFVVADPRIIPSAKDAEEVKKQNQAYKNFSNLGNDALSIVRNLNGYDRTGLTNNYASLQQKITEMRLQAKEMANLGVLNGPDLGLVDQTLGGLDLVTLNRLGPEAAAKRIEEAISTAESKLNNAASARGYKSKAVSNQEAEMAELEALRAKAGA